MIAATAKSLQSCPTLCYPTDGSPPGSTVPGILQARTLEWIAFSFSNVWKWCRSVVSLSDPMDCSPPGSSIQCYVNRRTEVFWVLILQVVLTLKGHCWTSLVVQRVRICLSVQGTRVPAATRSPSATTGDPMCPRASAQQERPLQWGAPAPQLEKDCAQEAKTSAAKSN